MLRRTTCFFKPCPNNFLSQLNQRGFNSFFGVPDSLLKELCTCITGQALLQQQQGKSSNSSSSSNSHHVIAANEGNAIGLASGYYLASGSVPVVYMQNSGLGNCVNPLTSLTHKDVYNIPMLLLIGWRGRPGSKKDEPQHVAMGRLTEKVLEACDVPYTLLDGENATACLDAAKKHVETEKTPFAILVDRDTFASAPSEIAAVLKSSSSSSNSSNASSSAPAPVLTREGAIEKLIQAVPKSTPIVSTTGMPSRELFEARKRAGDSNASDFLTVGSMGHCSSIAGGIILGQQGGNNKNKKVVCLDGDGAFLMHLGAAAVNAADSSHIGSDLVHVVVNNGAHDSVGGQPTVGFDVDLTEIAKACGYRVRAPATTEEEINAALKEVGEVCSSSSSSSSSDSKKPFFVELRVKKGNRKDLGRPTSSAGDNRKNFMEFLQK